MKSLVLRSAFRFKSLAQAVVQRAKGLSVSLLASLAHTFDSTRQKVSGLKLSGRISRLKVSRAFSRLKLSHAVALIIIAAIVVTGWVYSIDSRRVYYVAYVGRYLRPSFDDLHARALQKYLDELNLQLRDYRLELKIFSNNQTEGGSRAVYEEILKDQTIIAAVDNTWGKELQSISDLLSRHNLPVISMNADKGDRDFNSRVAFISYDDRVPRKVSAFAHNILKVRQVIFVAEQDYKLSAAFLEEFEKDGITTTPLYVGNFRDYSDAERDRLLSELDGQIEQALRNNPQKAPTVILNVHGQWGSKIIGHLDEKHENLTIVGGPYIIDSANYRQKFGLNDNGNRLIIFTYPHDSSIDRVHRDVEEIKVDGAELGKPNDLLYVKRCLDAIAIIRAVLLDERVASTRTTIARDEFIDFFRNRLAGKRYPGEHDLYVFDKDLRLADERSFEEYFEGKTYSYEQQLDTEDEPIPTVYFELTEISFTNIDLKSRTFHADFICAVTSDQAGAEKSIHFPNARAGLKMEPLPGSDLNDPQKETERKRAAKRYVKTFKVSAEFDMAVDAISYPFDTQQLAIEIALSGPERVSRRLSFDLATFDANSSVEWTRREFYVTKDNHIVRSPIRTENAKKSEPEKYQTVTLRVIIERRWEGPFALIGVSLFMIALIAIALLFIRDGSFDKGQAIISIFLGLIAYSAIFYGLNPGTDPFSIAARMFYGTFLTVLAVFLKICFVNSSIISESTKRRINANSTLIGTVALTSYALMILLIIVLK